GGEEARLEPAAVLIEALQVHVGRPEALVALHGREVGGARVKPAVQGVLLPGKAGGAAAVGAGVAVGEDLFGGALIPGVGALGGEEVGDGLDGLLVADGLAAVLAVEHRDGKTPPPLAGDAPVASFADH